MKFLSFCSMTFSASLTNCPDKYGSHMTIRTSLVLVVVMMQMTTAFMFNLAYSSFASTLSSVVAKGH